MILPIPHPWGAAAITPCAAVQLDRDHRLWILAPFHGDPPPAAEVGVTDRLWEHEVVELFVGGPGPDYLEVEVGPHGHHLVLRLRDVRQPAPDRPTMPVRTRRSAGWWAGVATLDPAWLPAPPWRALACHVYGPSARVHLTSHPLPGLAPDFHQPHHWAPAPAPAAPDPRALAAAAWGLSLPARAALPTPEPTDDPLVVLLRAAHAAEAARNG